MIAPLSFDPKNYGLEPHPSSTACYRGYWCEYDITDDGLFLENLYLFNGDGNYPEFLGKSIAPIEYQECDVYRGEKKIREKIPGHMGHRVYKDVHLLIPYSGKVLFGKELLREYYIHMGYQRPFAYKTFVKIPHYACKSNRHRNKCRLMATYEKLLYQRGRISGIIFVSKRSNSQNKCENGRCKAAAFRKHL